MSRDPGDECDHEWSLGDHVDDCLLCGAVRDADAIPPLVREFVLANLPALTAMARVAEHGGRKHGGGMGPGKG